MFNSCEFDSSLLSGYSVVVQSAVGFAILFNKTMDVPVQFDGLESGQYNVVVFPLTVIGILGTDVAYTQQVQVEPPSPINLSKYDKC